jgi:DNA-binding CsgD family transcriptional regulator
MHEIADILKVTRRTVAFHKYEIMERLRVRTNTGLVRYAIERHVISTLS